MPKRMEQNLFVHIGKSEAKVTNGKRLIMRSRYSTVEANYRQTVARPICDSFLFY